MNVYWLRSVEGYTPPIVHTLHYNLELRLKMSKTDKLINTYNNGTFVVFVPHFIDVLEHKDTVVGAKVKGGRMGYGRYPRLTHVPISCRWVTVRHC